MLPPGFAIRAASLLLVALIVLAGASAFTTRQGHTGSSRASRGAAARSMARSVVSSPPGEASMPATPEYSGSDGPLFGNDADNEVDGTGDPLGVFAMVVFWLLLLREGRLLSASYDGPAKPSFISCSVLERPG
jgi:hypothetical protein